MKAPGWGGQLEEPVEPPATSTDGPLFRHPLPRAIRNEFAILGVLVLGFALAVKVWLRPQQLGSPAWLFFYGVAPSFCMALGSELFTASRRSIPLRETMWGAAALLIYEFLQPFIPGRRFDPFDVVAIIVGTAIYLAYRKWRTRQSGVTHDVAT